MAAAEFLQLGKWWKAPGAGPPVHKGVLPPSGEEKGSGTLIAMFQSFLVNSSSL